jgi:AcrR family transcriptional regulator
MPKAAVKERARRSPSLPPRDEQAAERRRQLVRVASDLIEQGGVDHVTLPRVTQAAGCARTLVYRYFASREALLAGVLDDYFDRLDARVPEAAQRAAEAIADAGGRARSGAMHEMVELLWDVQTAAGFGGAILRATPHLSPSLRALVDASHARQERRFTEPLRAAGLSADEARVALDAMIASFVGLALRARAGALGRREAIDIHARATVGLIRGLLERKAAR